MLVPLSLAMSNGTRRQPYLSQCAACAPAVFFLVLWGLRPVCLVKGTGVRSSRNRTFVQLRPTGLKSTARSAESAVPRAGVRRRGHDAFASAHRRPQLSDPLSVFSVHAWVPWRYGIADDAGVGATDPQIEPSSKSSRVGGDGRRHHASRQFICRRVTVPTGACLTCTTRQGRAASAHLSRRACQDRGWRQSASPYSVAAFPHSTRRRCSSLS